MTARDACGFTARIMACPEMAAMCLLLEGSNKGSASAGAASALSFARRQGDTENQLLAASCWLPGKIKTKSTQKQLSISAQLSIRVLHSCQDFFGQVPVFIDLCGINHALQEPDCYGIGNGVPTRFPGGIQFVDNHDRGFGAEDTLHFCQSDALGVVVCADQVRHESSHRLHFLNFLLMRLINGVHLRLIVTVEEGKQSSHQGDEQTA